jgi:hypothetical protein
MTKTLDKSLSIKIFNSTKKSFLLECLKDKTLNYFCNFCKNHIDIIQKCLIYNFNETI